MKFNKQFSAYIEAQQRLLPGVTYVEFKRLKKLLKHCSLHDVPMQPSIGCHHDAPDDPSSSQKCPPSCAVCDQTFFPLLMKEVAAVLGCFNMQAQRLLQIHLASGLQKYILRLKSRHAANHLGMMQEGEKLVNYVYMNAVAIRKILKKYDKAVGQSSGFIVQPIVMVCVHLEDKKASKDLERGEFASANKRGLKLYPCLTNLYKCDVIEDTHSNK